MLESRSAVASPMESQTPTVVGVALFWAKVRQKCNRNAKKIDVISHDTLAFKCPGAHQIINTHSHLASSNELAYISHLTIFNSPELPQRTIEDTAGVSAGWGTHQVISERAGWYNHVLLQGVILL